jgi:hypothetical protein
MRLPDGNSVGLKEAIFVRSQRISKQCRGDQNSTPLVLMLLGLLQLAKISAMLNQLENQIRRNTKPNETLRVKSQELEVAREFLWVAAQNSV